MTTGVELSGDQAGTVVPVGELERLARYDGAAAGLVAVLDGLPVVQVADAAPGPRVALPRELVPPQLPVLSHTVAAAEGIVFARGGCRRDADARALFARLSQGLLAVRVGVTLGLFDQVVGFLDERQSGGEALLSKQMIIGQLADALGEIETARAAAGYVPDVSAHARIGLAGSQVAELFGARGYLLDHPARAIRVLDLVAGTWLEEGTS